MRAIVLAAGRGSRLGVLTENMPKCAVQLAGKPLIERLITALRAGGMNRIGIVRGYQPEAINISGVDYFTNGRWPETNMVTSLTMASEWLRAEPAIVSYSDIFYRPELIRRLAAAKGELVITYDRAWLALWSRRFEDPLSDAESFRADENGRLLEIGAKARSIEEIEGQYMGLLKMTPTAWRAVEKVLNTLTPAARDRLDMTSLLRHLLAIDFPIMTLATEGQWGEIDQPSDVELYSEMIQSGEIVIDE